MGGGGGTALFSTKEKQKAIFNCTECGATAYAIFFNITIRSLSVRRKAPGNYCPSCGILFVPESIKIRRKK